ncbi:MAG: carbohydrate kinase family protein [Bacillota bacterium]
MLIQVAVLGGAALDIVIKVNEFPQNDQIVFPLAGPYWMPGGSAANVAVGTARLGLKSCFLGKIGDDEQGKQILDAFIKEGVNIKGLITVKNGLTAQSIVVVNNAGDRIIYSLGGTAIIEKSSELVVELLQQVQLLYIAEAFEDVALRAISMAKGQAMVFYAPGGIFSQHGMEKLGAVISQTDYLLVSQNELQDLTEQIEMEASVRALFELGVKNIIVTAGKKGSLLFSRDGSRVEVPAFESIPVDTTGAGDAFAAGFIYSLLMKYQPRHALSIGNACAAMAIKDMGARSSMPDLTKLKKFLQEKQVFLR